MPYIMHTSETGEYGDKVLCFFVMIMIENKRCQNRMLRRLISSKVACSLSGTRTGNVSRCTWLKQ